MKQTRQCAVQTSTGAGLVCGDGSSKPEDAHWHAQLRKQKTRARFRARLPAATTCKPQHLKMSRTSLGGVKGVAPFSRAEVAAEPS